MSDRDSTHLESPLDGPFILVEPHRDSIRLEALKSRPFRYGVPRALKFNDPVVSAIVGLLPAVRPSAIFWRIGAVVVDALYRAASGALAHIRNKIGEIRPAFTNIYASRSVVAESRIGGILASLVHVLECVEKWMPAASVETVRYPAFGGYFPTEAAAGTDCAIAQMLAHDFFLISTVTSAQPAAATSFPWKGLSADQKSAKPFGHHIAFARHAGNLAHP